MRHSRRNAAFPWPANPQSRSLLTLGSTQAVSAQSDAGRKKSTQKPGPPPAQHVAAPGLSELSGFHSTSRIRKSGELEPNSLVAERGVGVGLPTPRIFIPGVREYFPHIMHNRVGKYSEGSKKSSRAAFRPDYFWGAEYALLWPQKIPSSTTGRLRRRWSALDRLHIGEAEIISIVSMWRGRKIPGSGGSIERS